MRTVLFVPGDRSSRIANAVSCGAEAVVVDLEDSVAEAVKHKARDTAVEALLQTGPSAVSLMVRVNAVDTPHVEDDVAALAPVLAG